MEDYIMNVASHVCDLTYPVKNTRDINLNKIIFNTLKTLTSCSFCMCSFLRCLH